MLRTARLLTLLSNICNIRGSIALGQSSPFDQGIAAMATCLAPMQTGKRDLPQYETASAAAYLPVTSGNEALAANDPPLTGEGKLVLTEGLLAEIARENQRLESAQPQEILAWAAGRFGTKFTMATAFGPEGMVLIHMLAEVAPKTPIFNLDTGYQFGETLELREEVKRRYGIEVELKQPDTTVEEYEQLHGGPLYRTRPDQCCFDRKVQVLQRAVLGMQAWASAIRRDQSPDRANAPIVGWDKKFGLVKVSPLATWTKQQVWGFITNHDIPYNPLHDQGYTSIGCWPCTRAVLLGEDERAGRWSGFAKTECGLHTQ
jgi:phosphoadenosine phosphosulfate reductase